RLEHGGVARSARTDQWLRRTISRVGLRGRRPRESFAPQRRADYHGPRLHAWLSFVASCPCDDAPAVERRTERRLLQATRGADALPGRNSQPRLAACVDSICRLRQASRV